MKTEDEFMLKPDEAQAIRRKIDLWEGWAERLKMRVAREADSGHGDWMIRRRQVLLGRINRLRARLLGAGQSVAGHI